MRPVSAGWMPKRARPTSVRRAPTRPAKPRTSPCAQIEADALEGALDAQVLDLQDDLAGVRLGTRVELHDLAADHLADGLVDGHVGARGGRDPGAVAHDRDAVGLLEDLLQAMGDEEDGHALDLSSAMMREELGHLVGRERGRGLVHDEHARVERERLGDLHRLLLGQRQRRGRGMHVEVDIEAGQHLLGLLAHPAALTMRPRSRWPMKMFSATVRSGKTMGSW